MSEFPDFSDLSGEKADRLLAHIRTADTRWFKISYALLNFGRRNVPEHRDSYNPVKRIVAEIGRWMDDRQIAKTNRRINERYGRG